LPLQSLEVVVHFRRERITPTLPRSAVYKTHDGERFAASVHHGD
jgi:hypothetical protein